MRRYYFQVPTPAWNPLRRAATPWPSSSDKTGAPENWASVHSEVRAQIIGHLGTPRQIAEVTHGNSSAFRGRFTTDKGDYFVKVSTDYSNRSRELIHLQVDNEAALPPSFPKPDSAGNGLCQLGERRVAWLAHQWHPAQNAATWFASGAPNVTSRLVTLCERATIPSTAVLGQLPAVGTALKQQYTGWWHEFEQRPELLDECPYAFDPALRTWLRDHAAEFSRIEETQLAPALVDSHVTHCDANTENALLADSGPSDDVFVDGQYGLGPPWLTTFQIFNHARRLGYASDSQLDLAVSQFGASRDLITAHIAGVVGFRIAQHAGLVSHAVPTVLPEPEKLSDMAAWLAQRIEGRDIIAPKHVPLGRLSRAIANVRNGIRRTM